MTTTFEIGGLSKAFGAKTVVDELDLEITDGEFLVLLGPSGCGKTTVLRCLAGLETPEVGNIRFRDRVVFASDQRIDVPTHKRNIGMVFQSYALWPHMTVRRNIAYPLRVRRMRQAVLDGWVENAAEMVRCGDLLDRYPAQLSGGQQQRIALARGLVSRPELVLLDEPLSNLDARLRDEVRTEIRELHQRLGFTAVLVTHDQEEALALGSKVAVMRDGKIEQCDTPERVFERPATEYVATFVGMANRLVWTRDGHGWSAVGGIRAGRADFPNVRGDRVVSLLRPEDLRLHRSREDVGAGRIVFDATLVTAEYGGRHFDVTLEVAETRLHISVAAADDPGWVRSLAPGSLVVVSTQAALMRLFEHDEASSMSAEAPALV